MGTSNVSALSAEQTTDHPHACGDKTLRSMYLLSATGSSPRVWGQDQQVQKIQLCYGIIPTRVGTSRTSLLRLSKSRDHPHACGDKKRIFLICTMNTGSSPRVWGQGYSFVILGYKGRIIPTRVGTSFRQGGQRLWHKDHPHACGDKPLSSLQIITYGGSSPRVWGQVGLDIWYQFDSRIIPTRVGTRGNFGKCRKL